MREMRDRIPLFLACNWGDDLETVRLLIDAGSDVNDKNSRGEMVLVSTLYYGKKEIIDLLIDRGATIPDEEETLRQVLYVTASNGMERPFNIAVEKSKKQDMEWWTGVPMDACARGGSVAIAKALMDKGAEIRQKNRYGIEPLHIAAENGKTDFVEFLLSKGVEMDSPSLMGKTALHFARENEHSDLAALLISKGASQEPPRFPVFKGPYLGQKPPGDVPELFAPGIVSSVYWEHSGAVFTPDGKELFWSRAINEGRNPRIIVIMHMKQENGVWTQPELAPFNFIDATYNHINSISPDGKRLYYFTEQNDQNHKAWVVDKTEDGWGEPRLLRLNTIDNPGTKVSEAHETRSGNLYLTGTLDAMPQGGGHCPFKIHEWKISGI
jgi:hypothetical protein